MIEKIKELRTMLPIPMAEAKQLLLDNDGDIETCVLLYTAKAIALITEATGASRELADKHYRKENFDINRAISVINDEIYDANYKPIEGVTKSSLQYAKDWVYAMETYDFATSLRYKWMQQTIQVMQLIPQLKKIAEQLQAAKIVHDIVFDGYNDSLPLEDFVRRNRQLDDITAFQEANTLIPLQIMYIKNEISKHWRNL